MQPNDTTTNTQVDTTKPTTQASTEPDTSPTLEDFTDWLLELHGNTFDAMDTATGDAYRELLGDFARTNSAINLLAQFKDTHLASQQPTATALALVNGGAA